MPTTLIVDDDEDMRTLVRSIIIAANEGLQVGGEAADGHEAVSRWRDLQPDVIVLDQRMPGLSGLEVAAHIFAERPDQRIILFSAYLDADIRARAADLGIATCVAKTDVFELPATIHRVHGRDRPS